MANHYRVLLVEDDPLIVKTLKMSLPYKGFEVTSCESFKQGIETFRSRSFDVVLLDVNLPDGNGFELCREIRKENDTVPILMLTAKTDEASAVQGLGEGADDYIRKPYGVQELTARITRLLNLKRRTAEALTFGSIKLDPKKRIAWAGETAMSLGRREFDILSMLVKKAGDVLSRNDIMDAFGEESDVYDRTIDSHLSHLRKKIKDAGAGDVHITPVYGVGYRLEVR
ncbi:MAG: response regulator transcription factor [Oligoflexia bacterium]|nr:response regulator transcription factor [Oligoflexia bacterium]